MQDDAAVRLSFYTSHQYMAMWHSVSAYLHRQDRTTHGSHLLTAVIIPASRPPCKIDCTIKHAIVICLFIFLIFNVCHPEVFNAYTNTQRCISQTQQNFIVFITVLGQHVSILIECVEL